MQFIGSVGHYFTPVTIYNLVMIHIIINNLNKIQLTQNDHRCLLAFAKKQDFEDRPGSRSVLWWSVLLGGGFNNFSVSKLKIGEKMVFLAVLH